MVEPSTLTCTISISMTKINIYKESGHFPIGQIISRKKATALKSKSRKDVLFSLTNICNTFQAILDYARPRSQMLLQWLRVKAGDISSAVFTNQLLMSAGSAWCHWLVPNFNMFLSIYRMLPHGHHHHKTSVKIAHFFILNWSIYFDY